MKFTKISFLALVMTLGFQMPVVADLIIKKGDKIAFLGDSITQAGARGNGYINLVKRALDEKGLKVSIVPAGKAGNKSNDMLARLDTHVLSKDPDWMLLSCGVNDVWHFDLKMGGKALEGVSLKDYEKNITEIVDQAEKKKIKVILMTSSMIGENPKWKLNDDLAPYNEFIRELAKERGYPLAEINEVMQKKLKEIPDVKGKGHLMATGSYKHDLKNKLTRDGVHMNEQGNVMMAKEVLRAMGMPNSDIKKAAAQW